MTGSPRRIAAVGAGLTGAVIARELAEAGFEVDVFDSRHHIAGNCHTERDGETGVMVHVYGPHIFHTDDEDVWNYVNRYETFLPYKNREDDGRGASLCAARQSPHDQPVFGKAMRPAEARAFIESQADTSITDPQTFEEQALRLCRAGAL